MGEIWVATKALILYNKRALIIQRSNYCGVGENEWEFAWFKVWRRFARWSFS